MTPTSQFCSHIFKGLPSRAGNAQQRPWPPGGLRGLSRGEVWHRAEARGPGVARKPPRNGAALRPGHARSRSTQYSRRIELGSRGVGRAAPRPRAARARSLHSEGASQVPAALCLTRPLV